ncbi:MAG: hypothetical protein WCF57_19285 [Pyrinomonadaceae bacterium]
MVSPAINQLTLAPLGAGDLIDRAVRLYRRHFMTLIRISAPPVVISALGSVLWTLGWGEVWTTSDEAWLAIYILLMVAGWLLLIGGYLFIMIVMGGATRNLVAHLLWNEPVSARNTYRAVRARFWSLLGATFLVGLLIIMASGVTTYAWIFALSAVFVITGLMMMALPYWIPSLMAIVASVAITYGALWLFFLMAGRFAYVPQVLLVEGKGVFASIGRSFTLARGNVRRLMAMTLFSTFAGYAALMLLVIPLGWYGYLNGINPSPWNYESWPAWYSIGYNVLLQSSSILLMPVWMLGLSLLYVDERVRHEGYDVELMAARRLGEIPKLSGGRDAPLVPAMVAEGASPQEEQSLPRPRPGSMLGLQ